MTTEEQIAEMTKYPFQYALVIEYDRETITVILRDSWMNKIIHMNTSTSKNLGELVNEAWITLGILTEGKDND